jgi:RND family efflux transporter MFP subunit
MKRMRTLAVVALAAVSFAAAGCKKQTKAELPPATGASAPALPTLPRTAADDQRVAASDDQTTGTLFAHAEAQLAPNAGGIIVEITVDENSKVKKGDVLYRLDPRDAALRRDQAQAALDAAKVNLNATKVEWDRTKQLVDANAVNRATWDQIDARYQGALVQVRQAEVMLQMAQKALGDTVGRSPIDGVVVAKLKSVGEMATMMPPTIILVVQDQHVLDLRVRVPEQSIAQVKAGDTLTAHFASLGLDRTAKVTRVNPTVDPRTRTVEIVAEIDNADGALKPGLLAEVGLGAPAAPATATDTKGARP